MKMQLSSKLFNYLLVIIFITLAITSLSGCGVSSRLIEEPEKTEKTEGTEVTQSTQESNDKTNKDGLKPTIYETVNNFPGVTMTIKEGTVTPNGLTVIFENKSKSEATYGEFFAIEKKIEGKWYQLAVVIEGNYAFNSIGYNLNPEEKKEFEVNWNWLYGSLDVGEYRIVKDVLDFRGTGDYDKYYLAAEWNLGR